jgi:hypothetical protein
MIETEERAVSTGQKFDKHRKRHSEINFGFEIFVMRNEIAYDSLVDFCFR